MGKMNVVSLAETWIEIPFAIQVTRASDVVSLAETWIEIRH